MKISRVQDLIPDLADEFVDFEISDSFKESLAKQQQEYKKCSKKLAKKYLFYDLHDSYVMRVEEKNSTWTLKINEMATLQFAAALIQHKSLDIDSAHLEFPLQVLFHNSDSFDLLRVDETGDFHPAPVYYAASDTYLNQRILNWKRKNIIIAFVLWSQSAGAEIIYASCERIDFLEEQFQAWHSYFGTEYDDYYRYFDFNRTKGRYLSDFSLCKDLIEEFEDKVL